MTLALRRNLSVDRRYFSLERRRRRLRRYSASEAAMLIGRHSAFRNRICLY